MSEDFNFNTAFYKRSALVEAIEITKAYASSGPQSDTDITGCLEDSYIMIVKLAKEAIAPDQSS